MKKKVSFLEAPVEDNRPAHGWGMKKKDQTMNRLRLCRQNRVKVNEIVNLEIICFHRPSILAFICFSLLFSDKIEVNDNEIVNLENICFHRPSILAFMFFTFIFRKLIGGGSNLNELFEFGVAIYTGVNIRYIAYTIPVIDYSARFCVGGS